MVMLILQLRVVLPVLLSLLMKFQGTLVKRRSYFILRDLAQY